MFNTSSLSHDAKRILIAGEILLVLLVVGLVINGVWQAAQAVQADYRSGRSIEQLVPLIDKLRQFTTQGQVDEGLAKSLLKAGLLPADMVSDGKLVSVWSTEIQYSALGNADRREHFVLTYHGVPKVDCRYFIKRIADLPKSLGLFGIATISGELLKSFPVSEEQSKLACQYNLNPVALIFKLKG